MEISTDKVLAELAKIGFSDLRDFAEWNGGEVTLKPSTDLGDNSRVISEVSQGKEGVKIKLWDKLNALEKIMKHLHMFDQPQDPPDTEGKDTIKIKIGGIDVEIG